MIEQTQPETGRFEALLTIEDVAALLRMPVASLRYWRVLGTVPRGFIGSRRLRYRPDDVVAWIHCRRDAPRHRASCTGPRCPSNSTHRPAPQHNTSP